MSQSLPRRLRLVFILQAVTASLAVMLGLTLAGYVVKDLLSGQRVRAEAGSWWDGHARDPAHPLPRTSTVNGYFVPAGATAGHVPPDIRHLSPGLHDVEIPDSAHRVLVEDRPEGRLYLRISFRLVEQVVWWTSLVSTLLATLAIVAVSWLSYRSSKRLVTPVNRLAQAVARWDPLAPDEDALAPVAQEAGTEVAQLGGALRDLALRTRQFVQRERDFTRDASHELRTPLTVIRVATDMMRADAATPERMQRSLQRIQRAGQDMETVIDAFLILARESEVAPQVEDFDVADVVYEAVDKARPMLASKPVSLEVLKNGSPRLRASPRVLMVMLDNLLSNACTFTEQGRIEVRVEHDRVVIHDTGIGMDQTTLQRVYDPFYRADQFSASGKGMGLSIVRRLGDRFGWPVALQSVPGEGTSATIHFDRFSPLA